MLGVGNDSLQTGPQGLRPQGDRVARSPVVNRVYSNRGPVVGSVHSMNVFLRRGDSPSWTSPHTQVCPNRASTADGPSREWITLADLGVIVAGVALLMTIPSRALGWPPFLSPPPLLFFVVMGGLRLTVGFGLVLALVVLFRRGRYGGPVRPAEWLALGLASLGLLDAVPNLDEAVNAYYAAVGSTALDFGVARWLLSAPAAAGVVLVVAGLVLLRRRDARWVADRIGADGRRDRGWDVPLVLGAVRGRPPATAVAPGAGPAGGPIVVGLAGPGGVRGSRYGGERAHCPHLGPRRPPPRCGPGGRDRRGRVRVRVWTELAAFADAVVVALLLTVGGPQRPDLIWWVSWVVSVGLISWWITGRLGVGRNPSPSARSSAA